MMYNNKIIATGLLGLMSLSVAGTASAAGFGENGKENGDGIISALVSKFGLNKADVESFFKSQAETKRAQMETKQADAMKERLAGAVVLGKLTQTQSDSIIAEQASVKSQLDSLKASGKTGSDLMAARKSIIDGARTWATTNNIPSQYAMFAIGGGMHGERGGEHGRGMNFGHRNQ